MTTNHAPISLPPEVSFLSQRLAGQGVWQASIFKVGDDVRQDMLALQIIQLFRDVFQSVGLSLYHIPYRMVATASGVSVGLNVWGQSPPSDQLAHHCPSPPLQCGVIDVVPDSKSRDQIGKQTQVSLNEYFHSVYGGEDSIPYQEVTISYQKSTRSWSGYHNFPPKCLGVSQGLPLLKSPKSISDLATHILLPTGRGQLCPEHGCLFSGQLPAADQRQTQWQHHGGQTWTHHYIGQWLMCHVMCVERHVVCNFMFLHP